MVDKIVLTIASRPGRPHEKAGWPRLLILDSLGEIEPVQLHDGSMGVFIAKLGMCFKEDFEDIVRGLPGVVDFRSGVKNA
jgi:hypothetical protein